MKVPVTLIKVKTPVRIDAGNIAEMAETIREFGLLHPVVVRQTGEEEYELIAGYRRLKACEQLGWTEIPITIINAEDELRKLDTLLHENLRRKDLNYMELAESILDRRKYWEQVHGVIEMGRPPGSRKEEKSVRSAETFIKNTAEICKFSETLIYNLLQLNDLDEDLKEQVRERTLPYRVALTMQRERRQPETPQKISVHQGRMPCMRGLPNQEWAVKFCEKFQGAPNLAQLIFLVRHVWQVTGESKERVMEWEKLDLEHSYYLMQWCGEVMGYLQYVMEEIKKIQEKLI